MLLVLFITDLQIALQILNDHHQLFFVFTLGSVAATRFPRASARTSSSRGLSIGATSASRGILAVKLALSNLLFNLGAQEFALIEADRPLFFTLPSTSLLGAFSIFLYLIVLGLLLGDLENLTELVGQEVGHGLLLSTSTHVAAIVTLIGESRL